MTEYGILGSVRWKDAEHVTHSTTFRGKRHFHACPMPGHLLDFGLFMVAVSLIEHDVQSGKPIIHLEAHRAFDNDPSSLEADFKLLESFGMVVEGRELVGGSSPKQPEIVNMLVLSTAHISLETSQWLTEDAAKNLASITDPGGPLGVLNSMSGSYGWITSAPGDDKYREELVVPSDLKKVLDFAAAMGCGYVYFDRDGEVIDDLPKFDW